MSKLLVVALALGLIAAPAFADKPNKNKGKGNDHGESAKVVPQGGHFGDSHRTTVHGYYDPRFQQGKCPPGLAKKHNGCMPPGQAKKYSVGQPLASNVRYYSLPPVLITRLGQPPSGYRYVRVDDDILLLGLGTRLVVDALLGLGRT